MFFFSKVDEPLEECIDEAGIENDSEDFVGMDHFAKM